MMIIQNCQNLPSPADDRGTGKVGDAVVVAVASVVSTDGGERIDPKVDAVKLASCNPKPVGIIRPIVTRPV